MRVIVVLLLIILLPSLAHSKMYKWEDAEGVIHFTNDFTKVPTKIKSDVETRETKSTTTSTAHQGKSAPLPPGAVEPSDVYLAFHSALLDRKYAKAGEHLTRGFKDSILKEAIASDNIKELNVALKYIDSAAMHSINIRHSNINGDRAKVTISAKSEGEDYMGAIDFIVEDGAWKIMNDNWHVDD